MTVLVWLLIVGFIACGAARIHWVRSLPDPPEYVTEDNDGYDEWWLRHVLGDD